jgi:superfamily II DNA or RNA helicase
MTNTTSMDVLQIKDQEQRNALNAWAKAGFLGSIIAGTGFGKSRCGILAIGKLLKEGERAIVLVPTTQLQAQFEEEFKKWGYENVLPQTTIMCYQSAHKLQDEHFDIVVCDEVHLGLSPVYRKFFENNTYTKLLCMTATIPEEEEYKDYLFKIAPLRYFISLDKCVSLGLVSPYTIICIPVQLSEDERKEYVKANNVFVHAKYKLGQFNAFDNAKRIMSGNMAGDKGAAAMFYNSIKARKNVVQHAVNKVIKASELISKHEEDKILVFSGTNEFTDTMAHELGGESYHSNKGKKERVSVLDRFKSGENKILCSTKALNQGFDVPDASVGIIAGLDSKALPMIQRVGRLLRLNKDKTGKIYILYVQDSQEEKWLKSAIRNLSNVIWL